MRWKIKSNYLSSSKFLKMNIDEMLSGMIISYILKCSLLIHSYENKIIKYLASRKNGLGAGDVIRL